jgi:flagellar hook-basal body complex protein FliE
MSNQIDVNRLLLEMRALKAQTQAFGGPDATGQKDRVLEGQGIDKNNQTSFTKVMEQAVNKVNEVQQASSSISTSYLQGDPNVDVTDVMIASQKASVAFDSMVQVRNKLVEAYRDVMNMPL